MTFWDERRFTTISKEEINFSCARVGGWTHVKKYIEIPIAVDLQISYAIYGKTWPCRSYTSSGGLLFQLGGLFLNSFTTQSGTFKSRRFFLRVHILLSWAFAASLSNSCHEEGLVKLKKAIYYMIAFTPSVYMYIHGEPIKLAILYIYNDCLTFGSPRQRSLNLEYVYIQLYIYIQHTKSLWGHKSKVARLTSPLRLGRQCCLGWIGGLGGLTAVHSRTSPSWCGDWLSSLGLLRTKMNQR